jgi:hypothetical protein
MRSDKLLVELEELMPRFGYRIRKEKGSFRGGSCVLEGEKLIMVNRNLPVDTQIASLAHLIHAMDHAAMFIKPQVRQALEEIWGRYADRVEPGLVFDEEP